MPRYTTFLDRDPSNVRAEMMENLNQKISGIGDIYLQQKLKDTQSKKELQNAVKKAVVESVLTGKGKFKTPIDLNQLVSGGQLPDLGQFEATPDVSQMRAILGMKNLAQEMEQKRKLGVLGGQEEPSAEDIAMFTPPRPVLGRGKPIGEGGYPMLPEGATFGEGEILDVAGQRIGEYLPGYEPQKINLSSQETAEAMRGTFAPGIPKEDLTRKALGLSTFKGKPEATKMQQITNTKKVADNIASKADLQELIDNREAYEAEGVDVDKIIEMYSGLLEE